VAKRLTDTEHSIALVLFVKEHFFKQDRNLHYSTIHTLLQQTPDNNNAGGSEFSVDGSVIRRALVAGMD